MPKITEMFAFVVYNKDTDDEGIPAFQTPNGATWPMIGADMDRITRLMPLVERLAIDMGKPIKLVKFTKLELVATICGDEVLE